MSSSSSLSLPSLSTQRKPGEFYSDKEEIAHVCVLNLDLLALFPSFFLTKVIDKIKQNLKCINFEKWLMNEDKSNLFVLYDVEN